ncbi:MAG: dihydropteroate synthase [Candidatus Aminicenantes bacterium]
MVIRSQGKTIFIGDEHPLVIIGEKINPTGKKKLAHELLSEDFSKVRQYAIQQAEAGAHLIDVNVGTPGVDEEKILPQAVKVVMKAVDLPISIDSANPQALEAALCIYEGKALVNSVTGQEKSLNSILPMVKKHRAAVIGMAYDQRGPAVSPSQRLEVARKILRKAQELGISKENVLIDGLARPVSLEKEAASFSLQTIALLKQKLGINTVLGISNVSFGLPDRNSVNAAFLAMAAAQGLTCAILDPTVMEVKKTVLAANLLSGDDPAAAGWIEYYRAHKAP